MILELLRPQKSSKNTFPASVKSDTDKWDDGITKQLLHQGGTYFGRGIVTPLKLMRNKSSHESCMQWCHLGQKKWHSTNYLPLFGNVEK